MDQAREAISKFSGRQGERTDVDERINPAITQEAIRPTRHEETTKAVDREVHQDHHHTTVQPLQHREVLPEQHTHHALPVEERQFTHGDESQTRQRLEQESAQFRDSSRTEHTQHTRAAGQAVTGEHTHHHVHETVQPIINKETIRPEVVHTTVPIHETHHADTQFHGKSVLPTKTLDEFKGNLGGSHTRHEEYEGVPRTYNKEMQVEQTETDRYPDRKGVDGPGSHHTGGTGLADTQPFEDDGHRLQHDHKHTTGSHGRDSSNLSSQHGAGYDSRNTGTGAGYGENTTGYGRHEPQQGTDYNSSNTSSGAGHKKPSLMDKLNPKVDSNGDGKAGFMK